MADATYPLVYRAQGATEFVVQSSGIFSMDGSMDIGGDVDVESGGSIAVESGGTISVESGGAIVWPVTGATSSASGSTTLTTLVNNGVSFITSSGDTRKIEIGTPVAGCDKWIYNTAGTTGMVLYISTTTDAGIISTGATSTAHLMIVEGTTSGALAGWCHLVGKSTSRWILMDHSPTSQWVIASTSS